MDPILLHCCCGPCATYTIDNLRERDFEVNALWYNPNIHPFSEHERRLESMRTLASVKGLPLVVDEGYQIKEFLRSIAGHEEERCADCYQLRLDRVARIARENGVGLFTTTLFISPYQDQDLLKEVGHHVARKHGVEFYSHDLRSGYSQSREMARELGLYRQNYCGCIYSEWERYSRVKIDHKGSGL